MKTNEKSFSRRLGLAAAWIRYAVGAAPAIWLASAITPVSADEGVTLTDLRFDLGVDITRVVTSVEVQHFIAMLSLMDYRAITLTCRYYLQNPSKARTTETLRFCVLSGL